MTADRILAELRASGYRLTAPRRKLVEILLQAREPLTAEEIYRRMRQAQVTANLSTVYRNLAAFCEMGWLAAVPGGNGERYYRTREARGQPVSILCLDCGQITPLRAAPASLFNEAVRDLGFNAETLSVALAARCETVCPHKAGAK